MWTYINIVKRHLTTPIFLVIVLLSTVLLFLGEKSDAVFVLTAVLINILFGMFQEIRSNIVLKKIELISKPRVKILKNNQTVEVDYDDVKVGDLLILEAGDEIPVDGVVTKSFNLECDESILTGEANPIKKKQNDLVYASSIVVAGKANVLAKQVGDDTRTGRMAKKIKNYDPKLTPLQGMLSSTIQKLTFLALILAATFYVVYTINDVEFVKIIKTITTAAITVVPEGLLLASTVFLAYGSLKLTQAKVLPQKISAIESMALIDILCVDKTGTLTSPDIKFNELFFLRPFSAYQKRNFKLALGILAKESESENATSKALRKEFSTPIGYELIQNLAFSSSKKMSGIKAKRLTTAYNVILGAPEYVSKMTKLTKEDQQKLKVLNDSGLRTLLLVSIPDDTDLDNLKGIQAEIVGFVTLNNYLRDGVVETITYLQSNDIKIKVISGDNPNTVSYIAKQAGIHNFDQVVTGAELELIKDNKIWDETVLDNAIFARILPHQKEKIVATFKRHGFYTGMVGDGVNDALALKESDLGIAMHAGAAATRRISDIVLLNNSFNSLPIGMKLGNKIIQSIEFIACLFFHKIIFGIVLSILTLLFGVIYPFLPRHITFMNIFLVTLPTIIFTVFPPIPRQRLNPKNFWKDTVLNIAPIGILSGIGIFGSYMIMEIISPANELIGGATVTVLAATFFGMFAVRLINIIFDTEQTETAFLATIIYTISAILIAAVSFGFEITRNFFSFYQPSFWGLGIVISFVSFVAWMQLKIAKMKRQFNNKS